MIMIIDHPSTKETFFLMMIMSSLAPHTPTSITIRKCLHAENIKLDESIKLGICFGEIVKTSNVGYLFLVYGFKQCTAKRSTCYLPS